jgi:ubiquinone/menaquinone biosynthesis C-methylase UbiE
VRSTKIKKGMACELSENGGVAKHGFDTRIVRYEEIHKVTGKDYEALVRAIDPKPGEVIFEGCAGYADVSKHVIDAAADFDEKPEIYILDESPVQINRAREELRVLPDDHVLLGDIRITGLPDDKFDKAVIKMGVHELPQAEQSKVFREMHRILRPGGKFIMWDLSLDQDTQKAFQDIIRKKDELAGFDMLVTNRYFQRHDELEKLFEEAGFQDVRDEHRIRYVFNPKGRIDELVSKDRLQMMGERGKLSPEDEESLRQTGQERVDALIAYIRERVSALSEAIREKIEYKDLGSDIEMTFDKIVMSGKK